MYPVLSLPQVNVLAMSESGNISWKIPEMPSFDDNEWCFAAVSRHHNTFCAQRRCCSQRHSEVFAG